MIEIRLTDDGSHTLFVPELNEHYHSSFGAVQESRHVFIDAGLNFLAGNETAIKILEVGFGTGLNALLTALSSSGNKIDYTGIEAFPVNEEITGKLNYTSFLDDDAAGALFSKIHEADWNQEISITQKFTIRKINAGIQDVSLENEIFDLIYFDAFAPEVQAELWTEAIFAKLFRAMKPDGILVTYSSKGLVKQNMRAAGFEVKRLAGPPGKRHMLRAQKRN